ncbi:MAG: DUF6377 domain-containing protein [Bacteroides sp.]|nr:DUF6377 domain-containing protein [Bacteroides sp.]
MSSRQRYTLNHEIYREYYTYRSDSAMRYVYDNLEIARQEQDLFFHDRATIALSMLLSTTGLYLESIENLGKIDRSTLDEALLPEYYFISEWTYNTAAEYSNDSLYAPRYNYTKGLYRDSIFALLAEGTYEYNYYQSKVYMAEGRIEEALELFLKTYQQLPVDTRLYAMVTYNISTIYKRFGNLELCEKFLILASISDQVCPLKENLAMQELSLYLFQYKPHDLERAYRYIQCSMEDARFYNNRLRIVQISEKLPIIVKAFQLSNEKKQARLTLSLIIISLLSLLTILSVIYVYRQMGVVKKSRRQLSLLNEQLNFLNNSLQEANHTREEYVGLFMDLCSSYIEKLDRYREMVKRKITTGQVEDLYKMTSSRRAIEVEFDEFLHNFDSAFLSLYPGFVEEFNKLLLEDHRVSVKKGEFLNTELRIFALIRLGISDSSKIAAFLRYSPQTIYNYRTRVKNGAKEDRSTFEQDIIEIGAVGTSPQRC